jgi:hypothetical protein
MSGPSLPRINQVTNMKQYRNNNESIVNLSFVDELATESIFDNPISKILNNSQSGGQQPIDNLSDIDPTMSIQTMSMTSMDPPNSIGQSGGNLEKNSKYYELKYLKYKAKVMKELSKFQYGGQMLNDSTDYIDDPTMSVQTTSMTSVGPMNSIDQTGGNLGDDDEYYKLKYLKYKTKVMKIRSQL